MLEIHKNIFLRFFLIYILALKKVNDDLMFSRDNIQVLVSNFGGQWRRKINIVLLDKVTITYHTKFTLINNK